MMKRLLMLILALSMLLPLQLALQPVVAQDEAEVRVFIVGPDALGISDNAVYTVTVVGGPAEEGGKWRVSAHLTGKNVTDAIPNLGEAFNVTQESNIFQINVTAPSIAQDMKLNIEAASLLGANISLVKDTFDLAIVDPISLRATVKNPSSTTLKNVLVNFKVDGELIGSAEAIEEIGPLGEGIATFSWITKDISPGRHELGIEIDLNGDGVVDETRGETFYTKDFYGPQEGPGLLITVLLVIFVIVILLLLPSTLSRKRRR
jgi:hypothetical protein